MPMWKWNLLNFRKWSTISRLFSRAKFMESFRIAMAIPSFGLLLNMCWIKSFQVVPKHFVLVRDCSNEFIPNSLNGKWSFFCVTSKIPRLGKMMISSRHFFESRGMYYQWSKLKYFQLKLIFCLILSSFYL